MLRNILAIIILSFIGACGGVTGALSGTGDAADSEGGTNLSGTINIPAPSSTGFGGLVILPALSLEDPFKSSSIDETPASGAGVEILNASFEVIATTTADENGNYSVEISDENLLVDTVNDATGATLTYFIRATATNADGHDVVVAGMESMLLADATEEAAAGEDPFSGGNADNTSSLRLLLLYGANTGDGDSFNPLTATEAPPAISEILDTMALSEALVAATDSSSEDAVGTTTADDALRGLEEALAYTSAFGALSDGTSAADAALILFTTDETTSTGTLAALLDRIQDDLALQSYAQEDLFAGADTAEALKDTIESLATSAEFDETAKDSLAAEISMGAVTIGRSIDEVRSMAATEESMGALTRMVTTLRQSATDTTDRGALIDGAAGLISPIAILAASQDPVMEAGFLALLEHYLQNPSTIDLNASPILGAVVEAQADDSDFWTDLAGNDGSTVDPEAVSNVFSFVSKTVEADDLHLDGSDGLIMNKAGFFDAAGITDMDWSAIDQDTFEEQIGALNEEYASALTPGLCAQQGVDFCGKHNPGLDGDAGTPVGSCSCTDNCTTIGNCCDDKIETCGATWSVRFLINWGVTGNQLADNSTITFDTTADSDGDGVADNSDNCPLIYNPAQENSIGSGKGDACREDADHDGVPDDTDNCPLVPNPNQANQNLINNVLVGDACNHDLDLDGVCKGASAFAGTSKEPACSAGPDNCPLVSNTNQADTNGNGMGDACEGSDTDFDGIPDLSDNCPTTPNPNQGDLDGDGTGNICDADIDGDGIFNAADACPLAQGDLCLASADIAAGSSQNALEICNDNSDNDGNGQTDCDDAACNQAVDCVENCADGADNDGDGDADCDDSQCANFLACNSAGGDTCGNGACDDGEDPNLCPADCAVVDPCGNQVCDAAENAESCPQDCPNEPQAAADSDGDGVADDEDNCADIPNPDQPDGDSDGLGNECDQKTLAQVLGKYVNGSCTGVPAGSCPADPIQINVTTNAAGDEIKFTVTSSANVITWVKGNYAASGDMTVSGFTSPANLFPTTCTINATDFTAWLNPQLTMTCTSQNSAGAGGSQTYATFVKQTSSAQ